MSGQLEEFARALLEHEVLEREDIEWIMRSVPRMERRPAHGLRVVVAVVAGRDAGARNVRTSGLLPPGPPAR